MHLVKALRIKYRVCSAGLRCANGGEKGPSTNDVRDRSIAICRGVIVTGGNGEHKQLRMGFKAVIPFQRLHFSRPISREMDERSREEELAGSAAALVTRWAQ